MAADAFLVVGLGNPGKQYAGNRHNVGAMVADVLAGRLGSGFKAHKAGADVIEARLGARRIIVAKPRSYMNLSGGATAGLVKFFSLEPARVIAVHDELDVPFGQQRLKQGGGDAGHNGLKSVSTHLGNPGYLRLRFGIGRPPVEFGGTPADFVLEAFASAEKVVLPELLKSAADSVGLIVSRGFAAAMNQVNQRKPR